MVTPNTDAKTTRLSIYDLIYVRKKAYPRKNENVFVF